MKKIILVFALILANGVAAFCANVYKLDNGQTVVIQEVKNNPIVTIDTWIKTGSIDETDENNGVAHFLEHLFFKGTLKHAPGEFDKILETKGAINNAATSKDFTHYYITIPSKDFDLALELHADMLLNPLIPRKEMEKERKVVLEEICKDLNSPGNILYENLNSLMYSQHPYKRRVIGRSDVIETITRENVLNFYNEHYSPSNMITVIAGDIDSNHVIDKVKEYFSTNTKKTVKTVYKPEPVLTQQKRKVEHLDTQTGYMMIGFRGVPASDKDTYALDVLSTVLGDGRSSVLNKNLKEYKQIVNTVKASNSSFRDDGIFAISMTFNPDKAKIAENAVFGEIGNIQKNGINEEQLNLAKNIIERSTYFSRESITNIATEIGYTMVLTNDIKFYDNYLDKIKNVTLEDVKRVANKYLGVEKSAVSIVLPKDCAEHPTANIRKKTGTADLVSKNSETQKYKLSNGSTLLYTPNSANDIIAMVIDVKGGQLTQDNKAIGLTTAPTMLKGTKNYSSIGLSTVMEDNGITIAPSINSDIFSISVLTTKDKYDLTLKLLDEIVNNATFQDSEIQKTKTDILNSIKKMKDIPQNVALEEYRHMIFDGGKYSISSKYLDKELEKVTRDNIVNYYNKLFNPKNIVISINGNVDKDKTIKELNNIFTIKENNEKTFDYKNFSNVVPAITKQKTSVIKIPTTETAWIFLGWQTNGVLNEKEYATLQVIDSILGTGMSSRLFRDLREQQGLAYQLGSAYSAKVLRGTFLMYIGTNPKNVECAKKGLLDEINKLKSEYVGDKELKDAKEKLLGNYLIGLETNLDKAQNTGWNEASTRGYEFKTRYPQLINAVTDSDIIEVANKYFNDNYVLSIVTK